MLNGISNKLKDENNKTVAWNIFGAFAVKGLSLVLALFTMPAYMRFFQDQAILGIWYTIISILNWVMYFDLGLGNGLRNILPKAFLENDKKKISESISTTYLSMTGLVIALLLVGIIIIPMLNWNVLLNVDSSVIGISTLIKCVIIIYCGILLQFILKIITSIMYALQRSALVNLMALSSTAIIIISLYVVPSSTVDDNIIAMSYVNSIAMILPYIIASFIMFKGSLRDYIPKVCNFKKTYLPIIFNIGLSLCWLQLVFMIISSTNEFLISFFTEPKFVVDYQAYYRIFKTGAMIFSIALTPIWSAVTKSQASNNYVWIKKIYKVFLCLTGVCLLFELVIVPLLPSIMKIWLGEETIMVDWRFSLVFVASSVVFVLHNINTSIGNGISYFKVQFIWMSIAAVIDIPLSYFIVQVTNSWIGVVIANVLALLPYEIIAPIKTFSVLNKLEKETINHPDV